MTWPPGVAVIAQARAALDGTGDVLSPMERAIYNEAKAKATAVEWWMVVLDRIAPLKEPR